MLLELPLLCQVEVLKRLPPTAVDKMELVCRRFACLVQRCRRELARMRVFLTVTTELDLDHATVCVYLHPMHYNGSMENCMKRKLFKQVQVPIGDLEQFELEQHFGLVELESVLLTSRHRELVPLRPELVAFLERVVQQHKSHLRYFATRFVDFRETSEEKLASFLDIFRLLPSLDILKFESCQFRNFRDLYHLYDAEILARCRQFKELCSTRETSRTDELQVHLARNSALLSVLQANGSQLELLEASSTIHWPIGAFSAFIENWMLCANPCRFQSLNLAKTPELESIATELKQSPLAAPMEEGKGVVFKNKHHPTLTLVATVDSPLFFNLRVVDTAASDQFDP